MADRVRRHRCIGIRGFGGGARAGRARLRRSRRGAPHKSPRGNVENIGCEITQGDMRDQASMARAMEGARYLFHVAADYRLWARDPQEIVRNNLEGTRATMEAALESGVEKIVYTSSVATLKPIEGASADETSRHDENTVIGAYKLSKVVAERLVEKMIAERGLPATIVSPSTPYRPARHPPHPHRPHHRRSRHRKKSPPSSIRG